MAITPNPLTSGAGGVSQASPLITSNVEPKPYRLQLLAVASFKTGLGSAGDPPSSVTGCNLTWVEIAHQGSTTTHLTVTVLRALGYPSPGPLTINFSATQVGVRWSIVEFDGVDLTGTNGSGAIVQSVGAEDNTIQTSISATLSSFANSNNRPYAATIHAANEGTTPQTNWDELHDVAGATASLETQWRAVSDTAAGASWTTSSLAEILAIEIAAATSVTADDNFRRNEVWPFERGK